MSRERRREKPIDAQHPKSAAENWENRWGGETAATRRGFTPVATAFLRYAAHLKPEGLTPNEMVFVLHLMTHRWRADEKPHPSYELIAKRMNISIVYARKLAQSLQKKGMLVREQRRGTSNLFDLRPLFEKLAAHVEERQRGDRGASRPSDTNLVVAGEVDLS